MRNAMPNFLTQILIKFIDELTWRVLQAMQGQTFSL